MASAGRDQLIPDGVNVFVMETALLQVPVVSVSKLPVNFSRRYTSDVADQQLKQLDLEPFDQALLTSIVESC